MNRDAASQVPRLAFATIGPGAGEGTQPCILHGFFGFPVVSQNTAGDAPERAVVPLHHRPRGRTVAAAQRRQQNRVVRVSHSHLGWHGSSR